MESTFKMLRKTRESVLELSNSLTDAQLLEIPDGLNNHILWNMGHMVVTQQLLTYRLAGLPLHISDELVALYRKGSAPRDWDTAPDVQTVRDLCLRLVDKTVADYRSGLFTDMPPEQGHFPYPTSFADELKHFEDAVTFNNLHEGLHLGVIRTLRRLIS